MSYAMDEDRWGLRQIEVPAREIIDHGLGQGRSIIDPDVPAWQAETAVDLRHRIVDNADAGSGTFLGKLRGQLNGAPRGTYLLAAELMALHALPLGNIGGQRKLERVTTVLSWLDQPSDLPEDLRQALSGPGVFNGGVGFNVQVWQQLAWLLSFVEHWHGLAEEDRREALRDPWRFRGIVDRQDTGQLAIRNSLLYLAFPRYFLPIVSQSDKVAIRNAFAGVIGGKTGNDPISIDRDLHAIYVKQVEQTGGKRVHYYEEPWRSQWVKRKSTDGSVRAWLVRPRTAGRQLADRWRAEDFVSLAATHLGEIDPGITREELNIAVEEGYQHLDYAQRLALANEYHHFLSTMKPGDLVATVADDQLYAGVITGEPEFTGEKEARLQRPVTWTPAAVDSVAELAAPLDTEIEQQGTVVDITAAAELLAQLLDTGETPRDTQPSGPPQLAAATQELADTLHFGLPWLQKVVNLLQDHQQIVLYGPPGTGKTYFARKLANHLTGADAVRLVQFHPSYTYEDFFEGFRPKAKGDTAGFELVPGPLRQLAAAAETDKDRPYILVIDEINRAHLAKVFGELYFLLEYRDEKIELQYSPGDRFKLPRNIFFIGTMNTADRSIALVDAAMRRRFAFLELHPDEPPVRDLLARWATATGKNDNRALLLASLNAAIDAEDRDFKIGPSYLMKSDADRDGGLALVWEYSILPLLEEHYYGRLTRSQVHARFGLDAIRRVATSTTTA
jgi:5-methylcytosine-specific restriction enzyme B